MGVKGLQGMMAWAMTLASSLKTSSGETEGVGDADSGMSGGGMPQSLKSEERGRDSSLGL